MIDSHVHLDDPVFDVDRDAVIERAREAGIIAMVTVGSTLASSRAAVALAGRYPDVYAAVAVHPHDASDLTDEVLAELRTLAAHSKVRAVGETGLDFARSEPAREVQEQAFRRHIRLGNETGLPVIVHCREAFTAVLAILEEENGASRVIMHAFSGSPDQAQTCVARAYAVSLAGPVTFRNARRSVEVAQSMPLSSLLVETDAPVLAPVPFRGRRNEPAFLEYTVRRIADVKGVHEDEIAAATAANARRIYELGAT